MIRILIFVYFVDADEEKYFQFSNFQIIIPSRLSLETILTYVAGKNVEKLNEIFEDLQAFKEFGEELLLMATVAGLLDY